MAYTLFDYLITDTKSDVFYNFSGQLVGADIDRSYFVGNITDANNSNKEVLSKAETYIRGLVPPGTAHPEYPLAKAVQYSTKPVKSNSAAMVVVKFVYSFGGPQTDFSINISSSLQGELTNAEYDGSGNLKPIFVDYYPFWKDPVVNTSPIGAKESRPAEVSCARPIQNIVIARTVNISKAAEIEAAMDSYMGYTNSTAFRGRAIGTVLCSAINVVSAPYKGVAEAAATFSVKPVGWKPYSRVTSTEYGTPSNIWIAGPTHIANGIRQANVQKSADLNALVTLITS